MVRNTAENLYKIRKRVMELTSDGKMPYQIHSILIKEGIRRSDGSAVQLKQIYGYVKANQNRAPVFNAPFTLAGASLSKQTDDTIALAQLVLGAGLSAEQKKAMLQTIFKN